MVTPQAAHISGVLMAAHWIPADIERKTMNVALGRLLGAAGKAANLGG